MLAGALIATHSWSYHNLSVGMDLGIRTIDCYTFNLLTFCHIQYPKCLAGPKRDIFKQKVMADINYLQCRPAIDIQGFKVHQRT